MRILPGPWSALPPLWFCSINHGGSAFSVRAESYQAAVATAYARLHDEIVGTVDQGDPFALDTAQGELDALVTELVIFTQRDWDRLMLAETWLRRHARQAVTA